MDEREERKVEGERKPWARERAKWPREGGGRGGTGGNKALTGRVIPRYVTDGTTGCLMGSLRSSLAWPELRGRNREERRYPGMGVFPGPRGEGGEPGVSLRGRQEGG